MTKGSKYPLFAPSAAAKQKKGGFLSSRTLGRFPCLGLDLGLNVLVENLWIVTSKVELCRISVFVWSELRPSARPLTLPTHLRLPRPPGGRRFRSGGKYLEFAFGPRRPRPRRPRPSATRRTFLHRPVVPGGYVKAFRGRERGPPPSKTETPGLRSDPPVLASAAESAK